MNRVVTGVTDSRAPDLACAEGLVDQALAASATYSYAHYVKGTVLRAQHRFDEAIPEFETARTLNHNAVGALQSLGWCKLYTGSLDEVIPLAEQAIRLSPRAPDIGFRYQLIGTVNLLQSRTDEAIVWVEKGRSAMTALPQFCGLLAAAYALKGETERAVAELAEARKLGRQRSFGSIARIRAETRWEAPNIRVLAEATLYTGLRKAGMPEE